MEKFKRLSVAFLPHRLAVAQTLLLLLFSFVIFTSQASAVIRFTNRSLLVLDPTPSAVTEYQVSLTYTTVTTVGSIDLLFCEDPIPTDPCTAPVGLDLSNATLSAQTGETGYTIAIQTANHIILSRPPGLVGNTPSVYTFDNVVNPNTITDVFSARLSDYASIDASGPVIDLGSIISQTVVGIGIETQVPPMLIFCVGQQVSPDCTSNSGGNYADLGTISPTDTLTAHSQMAAGTNASNGYVITANGTTMEAGSNIINALDSPTVSAPGNSQFGINLVSNSTPGIGQDPDGASTNATVAPGFDTPNEFMYQDGALVASAPNVSLIRRFTVSYIVNTPPNLRAGVYTTTITYICTGRF
jgi:hypothetical protein